jgi:hypothetical protein
MARIFLCHASEDKAQIREVYHRLRAPRHEAGANGRDIPACCCSCVCSS